MAKRTWLVLGAESVMGRAFSREAVSQGDDVVLLGRDPDDLDLVAADLRARCPSAGVETEAFDPTVVESFPKIIAKCEEKAKNIVSVFSGLEAVYFQKECGRDLGKIKNMFQINYLAQIYFLTAASALLRKQNCGEIIVLGSTAGEYGLSDNYAYGSTKAALHVWLQGFYEQMAAQKIFVTTVKIDDTDLIADMGRFEFLRTDFVPEECAKICMKYAGTKTKVVYYPWFARWTAPFRRFIKPVE